MFKKMKELKMMGVMQTMGGVVPFFQIGDDKDSAFPIGMAADKVYDLVELEGKSPPSGRPLNAQLFVEVLERSGMKVTKVVLEKLEKDTYFSTIYLEDAEGKEFTMDAKPSDSFPIAIATKAQIFITDSLVKVIKKMIEEEKKLMEEEKKKMEALMAEKGECPPSCEECGTKKDCGGEKGEEEPW